MACLLMAACSNPSKMASLADSIVTDVTLNGGAGNSEVLEAIPTGAAVTILSVDGDWVHVEFDGKSGYCAAEYLSEYKPTV